MIGLFFVFKQKTAYEMRISDWSSDVCSSDLYVSGTAPGVSLLAQKAFTIDALALYVTTLEASTLASILLYAGEIGSASCREKCVRTCSSRWSPYHSKK